VGPRAGLDGRKISSLPGYFPVFLHSLIYNNCIWQRRVFCKQLTATQVIKKFDIVYGKRNFVGVFEASAYGFYSKPLKSSPRSISFKLILTGL
jgi:hypothetical protein